MNVDTGDHYHIDQNLLLVDFSNIRGREKPWNIWRYSWHTMIGWLMIIYRKFILIHYPHCSINRKQPWFCSPSQERNKWDTQVVSLGHSSSFFLITFINLLLTIVADWINSVFGDWSSDHFHCDSASWGGWPSNIYHVLTCLDHGTYAGIPPINTLVA